MAEGAQPPRQVLLQPSASPTSSSTTARQRRDTLPHRDTCSWDRRYRKPPKSQSFQKFQKKRVPEVAYNKTAKDLPKPHTPVGSTIPMQWLSPTPQSTSGFFCSCKPPAPSPAPLHGVCTGHRRGRLTCPEGIVLHPLCGSQCYSPAWPGCPSSSSASPACRSFAAAPLGTPARPSLQAHKEQARHGHGPGAAVCGLRKSPSPRLQPQSCPRSCAPRPRWWAGWFMNNLGSPLSPISPPRLCQQPHSPIVLPKHGLIPACAQIQPGCCSSL